MGGLLNAVLNLPGLNLTLRFAKPEVKYLVVYICTKQVHYKVHETVNYDPLVILLINSN